MKRMKRVWAAIATMAVMAPASGHAADAGARHGSPDAGDQVLAFDKSQYIRIAVTIDGVHVPLRWYKEVCYVARPELMADIQTIGGRPTQIANPRCGYQSLNIFLPESSVDDQQTALYLALNNSGWSASYIRASVSDGASYSSATSQVGAALKAGYVFIDVATRSKGIVAADGSYAGKAPAAVVDAKAAVRYLRLNDRSMPGSAERIVVNGTSGGGALGAIVGASGNSRDHLPHLQAVGAAGIDHQGRSTIGDNIFAVVAYCPITDMNNADFAYEWLYGVLGTRTTVGFNPFPAGSAEIASKFGDYLRSRHLRNEHGRLLTEHNMLDTIARQVIKAAERHMQLGHTIPALGELMSYVRGGVTYTYTNDWIDVDGTHRKVRSLDMERYLAFVATQARLKIPPGYDQTGISAAMSIGGTGAGSPMYGTRYQRYSNYTAFSWDHNDVANDGIGYDDTGLTWKQHLRTPAGEVVAEQNKLVNPLDYLGRGADAAPYWYLRHGTRDNDTAFSVPISLSRALAADHQVKNVNFELAWDRPHSGNYDVPEAMQWLADKLKDARQGPPHGR